MQRTLALLFVLLLAPACAPEKETATSKTTQPLVLLTDTLAWPSGNLEKYRDSLEAEHYRVLVSGFSGESAEQMTARLPWLLQPGVALFIYDEALAGPEGVDSLKAALKRMERDIPVVLLRR